MLTNKDRIEKLELDIQKLFEDSTKQFKILEKSLENIASSNKEGFWGASTSLMVKIFKIPTKDSGRHAILHGMVIIGVVKKMGLMSAH
jgi:hypothetical protein